jgi:hypothetical protein
VGRERIVEGLNHLPLRRRRQVNQHILAREQIDVRERRVCEQIMLGKDAELTDALVNLVAPIDTEKEVIETCWREHTDGSFWIETGPGGLDGPGIEISAKELERGNRQRTLTENLEQADRQGVDFFPGGAARHPHPQGEGSRKKVVTPISTS